MGNNLALNTEEAVEFAAPGPPRPNCALPNYQTGCGRE